MPAELVTPPPLTHRVLEDDWAGWLRWAEARREWRLRNDPLRADAGYLDDRALPWLLMHEQWGGLPPLLGGETAADELAARWAGRREPVW